MPNFTGKRPLWERNNLYGQQRDEAERRAEREERRADRKKRQARGRVAFEFSNPNDLTIHEGPDGEIIEA